MNETTGKISPLFALFFPDMYDDIKFKKAVTEDEKASVMTANIAKLKNMYPNKSTQTNTRHDKPTATLPPVDR
ncbi:unnamed protein product [Dovyalis caffra]|uniref:Uncharacterized protein n=1 Tax=Dovyalis caffra TaxID=77055 RepID=A0AAV1R0G7_9ROSI|nr:unnamed protein product [Dovyalis caffra]